MIVLIHLSTVYYPPHLLTLSFSASLRLCG